MAFRGSAVRSRLSPPKRSTNQTLGGLFHFRRQHPRNLGSASPPGSDFCPKTRLELFLEFLDLEAEEAALLRREELRTRE